MADRHEALFRPRRIAIVGASNNPARWGHRVMLTLQAGGFDGDIAPVNPGSRYVLGHRAYPSIGELPWSPDLAAVMVGREAAVGAVEELAARGCRYAVVHAGGFSETGPEGARLEARLAAAARRAGMRVLGPNCMNLMVAANRMNLTGIPDLPAGRLAFVSQSGNLAYNLLEYGKRTGLGLSCFLSVGNQADLGIEDLLDPLADDPHTDAVALYIEGLRPGSGRTFLTAAHRISTAKPLVALLGGRTESGGRASASHTGSLLGDVRVLRGILRQAGALEVERLDDLFPAVDTLLKSPPPRISTVALCGSGGGHATLASDALADRGVSVPVLPAETQAALQSLLPGIASTRNPVDWVGAAANDPSLYERTARLLLAVPEVGGLIFFGHFGGYLPASADEQPEYRALAAALGNLQRQTGKPILVHSVYARQRRAAFDALQHAAVPLFDSIDTAAESYSALVRYGRRTEARPLPRARLRDDILEPYVGRALAERRSVLLEPEALSWLGQLGLPLPGYAFATTAEDAVAAATAFGTPVALKLVSASILHKSAVGGVRLGLSGADGVRRAFLALQQIPARHQADFRGVLVTPMAAPGLEVAVGIARSDVLGHSVLLASGGTNIEAIDDATTRPAPLDEDDAAEMMEETRIGRFLLRRRHEMGVSVARLQDLMIRLSTATAGSRFIESLDLNPVSVTADGVRLLDARVLLSPGDESSQRESARVAAASQEPAW